eukprot:TRINITY_DN1431_c0_g1_i1.p1 TRINITY_DN1431_c0_g1~~TRINITY_DN1431_c0_g1_i1.p1  ORF type:complete len:173 (-),score=17.17 TRINITY_DN1431_c0_g1_i1:323-841(-)
MNDDARTFFIPDFSKCGEGIGLIGDAISTGVEGLKGVSDKEETGSEPFANECYALWTDIPLCCLSYWCGCFVVPRNQEQLAGESCEGLCLAHCLLCGCCFPCSHAHYRTQFRKKHNLKGSKMMDCLLSYCCALCLTYQEAIELGKREHYKVPYTSVGTTSVPAPQQQEMTKQ